MALPSGQVVRMAFTIAANASTGGDYDATSPAQEYGYSPLTLTVAVNATRGAGRTVNAISGLVTVTRAEAAGGLFAGTVDAQFADGTRLTGGWLCLVGE